MRTIESRELIAEQRNAKEHRQVARGHTEVIQRRLSCRSSGAHPSGGKTAESSGIRSQLFEISDSIADVPTVFLPRGNAKSCGPANSVVPTRLANGASPERRSSTYA